MGMCKFFPRLQDHFPLTPLELSVGSCTSSCFIPLHALTHSSGSDLCEPWHRRMDHLHHTALKMLRYMVTFFLKFNTKHSYVCRGCALGKYTKTAFSSSDRRSAKVLDLIHSELCGPMSSVSLRLCDIHR